MPIPAFMEAWHRWSFWAREYTISFETTDLHVGVKISLLALFCTLHLSLPSSCRWQPLLACSGCIPLAMVRRLPCRLAAAAKIWTSVDNPRRILIWSDRHIRKARILVYTTCQVQPPPRSWINWNHQGTKQIGIVEIPFRIDVDRFHKNRMLKSCHDDF